MSDTTRTSRPTRRFSALKPPTRRAKPPGAEGMPEVEAESEAPETSRTPDPAPPAPSSAERPQKASDEARIAKVMARAGLCSRRDAEAWIGEGRVAVNGAVIASPALNIGPADTVTVDGYPIDKPERTRLFLFHKTRGLVTTARDPDGRPTVFDVLPPEVPRLVTIGRLDINTEGLLLLTNDGGLARLLELPATGWIRRYRVRANGTIDQGRLDALAKGLTVDGVTYAGIAAKLDRIQGANLWLTMGLKEGKNREIKKVLEHLGLAVTRLIRISFGPFQLGDLAENAVEEVRTRVLRDQLGSALAQQAGVDFEGRIDQPVPAAAPAVARSPSARSPSAKNSSARDSAKAPSTKTSAKAGSARSPSTGTAFEDRPPRRKTRRTATEDRRGRKVTVERIMTAAGGEAALLPRRRRDEERSIATDGRDRPPPRGDAPGARPRTLRQADRRDPSSDGVRPGRDEGAPRPAKRRPSARDREGSGPRPSRPREDGDRAPSGRPASRGEQRGAPRSPPRAESSPKGAPGGGGYRGGGGSDRGGGQGRPGAKGGGPKGRPRG